LAVRGVVFSRLLREDNSVPRNRFECRLRQRFRPVLNLTRWVTQSRGTSVRRILSAERVGLLAHSNQSECDFAQMKF
jgi:hypothetical protein